MAEKTVAANILLNGCNGRMGRMFTRIAAKYDDIKVVAGLDIVQAKPEDMAAPPPYPVFIVDGSVSVRANRGGDVSVNRGVSGGVSSSAGAGDGKSAGDGDGAGKNDGNGDGADTGRGTGAGVVAALEYIKDIDINVIVDFSHHSALEFILTLATERSIPAVLATTGYTASQIDEIAAASKIIPVFQTPNMSVGINLMNELIRIAASALGDGFDIELVEAHHNQKLDAPSGTALMLADTLKNATGGDCEYVYDRHSIRAKRGKKEIGIHAIRGGTIVGEHDVIFAGNDEVITIKHTAASREVFAEGAIRAARFIVEGERKPGRYNMRDILLSDK